jgi:DNA-binding PadR family transcriptional regulator
MSLRHALLGMLSIGPMTGYDLLDHFDRSAGLVWSASQAQIYPELRAMEHDGLLTAEIAPRGKHGRKRIYSVTPRGLAELKRWVGEPIVDRPSKDATRLKVSYLDTGEPDEARALFAAHIAYHTERLRLAEERLSVLRAGRMRRQSIGDAQERAAMHAYRSLVLEGQIESAKMEIAWGRRGLAIVARLTQRRKAKARGIA